MPWPPLLALTVSLVLNIISKLRRPEALPEDFSISCFVVTFSTVTSGREFRNCVALFEICLTLFPFPKTRSSALADSLTGKEHKSRRLDIPRFLSLRPPSLGNRGIWLNGLSLTFICQRMRQIHHGIQNGLET
uniref:Secreted protein n=1 Tax=Ditylum brightwellii TaxID=49249 RepID=A0A7S4S5L2_9STRA